MLWLLCSVAFARLSAESVARLELELDRFHDEAVRKEVVAAIHEDPTDLVAHLLYVGSMSRARATGPPVYETYRRWLADDPRDPIRRFAVAVQTPGPMDGEPDAALPPGVGAAWCDETLGLMDLLPSDPDNRARALWVRHRRERRCGRDTAETSREIASLAATNETARFPAVWIRAHETAAVDDTLAAGIANVVGRHPWRVDDFAFLWDRDARGSGLEAARKAVSDVARAAASRPEPYLSAAGRAAMATAAGRKPPRRWPDTRINRARAILAPADRLAALRRVQPEERSEVADYWRARFDAASEVGDRADAFLSLGKLATWTDDIDGSLQFVRMAVARRQRLRTAETVAERLVVRLRDPLTIPSFAWDPYRTTRGALLADALDARSTVRHLLADDLDAMADAHLALLLDDRPEYHLHLGVAAYATGQHELAFGELSRAFSSGQLADPANQEGTAALAALWARQQAWNPTGLPGWLAASAAAIADAPRPAEVPSARSDPRVGTEIPDLPFTVDGQPRTLSSYPGIVVLFLHDSRDDLSKLLLPHLDAVARGHGGRVTVIVLTGEAPPGYLRGVQPGFVDARLPTERPAWTGAQAVPSTWVVGPDRRVLAFVAGDSADHTSLDDALASILYR